MRSSHDVFKMNITTLLALLMLLSTQTLAWTSLNTNIRKSIHNPRYLSSTQLRASPMGPIARAKKAKDPQDYERVIVTKMKQENMTRAQAEADYNSFLENPPFYYALDKKEEYYKNLGYKDIFDGMIGEAEKLGPEEGKEMRERIAKFRLRSKIKAYSVLLVTIAGLYFVRDIYNADPNFLKGGLPDYHY